MESNIDRKERTVYVTGMHPKVTEDMIYDLFEKVGLVEKVVMHENDDGEPHHALVVFKYPESVMYSISVYNGYRLFDQSLSMRPLRESSHAAVFQRAGPSRNISLRIASQQMGSPPASPIDKNNKGSPRLIVKRFLEQGLDKKESPGRDDQVNSYRNSSPKMGSYEQQSPMDFYGGASNYGHGGGYYNLGNYPSGGYGGTGGWHAGSGYAPPMWGGGGAGGYTGPQMTADGGFVRPFAPPMMGHPGSRYHNHVAPPYQGGYINYG